MIELRDTTEVHAFWFLPLTSAQGTGDWLACILKQKDEDWRLVYRFRWHRDDKVFDSNDVKSWYGVRSNEYGPEAPADLVSMVSMVAATMTAGPIEYIEVLGNGDKAVELLGKSSFAHIKSASDEAPN